MPIEFCLKKSKWLLKYRPNLSLTSGELLEPLLVIS